MRLETPIDLFDDWLSTPPAKRSEDPRFEVKQARPQDFERIYDCVDESFGVSRPRSVYEWRYRANPYGQARVWYVSEVSTGRIVKTGAYFPWPIAYDGELLKGSLAGDFGTVPEWQRRGLSAVSRNVRRSHPWHGQIVSMSGPNAGSRAVITKSGEENSILGALLGGVAVLDGTPFLQRAGLPIWLSAPIGLFSGRASSLLRRVTTRPSGSLRLEPLARFSSDLDGVTLEAMRFPKYWCPHNSDWLNWRYLDHPVESYSGFVLLEKQSDRPIGYSVLRLDGEQATLSEFAVSPRHAASLLSHTLESAEAAGSAFVNFFGTPGWRHWGLFRRAGFIAYVTNNFMDATDWSNKAESEDLASWQVTPGDRDYR